MCSFLALGTAESCLLVASINIMEIWQPLCSGIMNAEENCTVVTSVTSSTLQLILTLALPWSFKNGHRVHCGLHQWDPQVNKSPAVVHTYQGLPPAVRRTRRRTPHYDAEMLNRLLMYTVIVCKCLAIKNTKRGQGWPLFKKIFTFSGYFHM